MKNKFIKRIHRYAVKKLSSGAARLYILNAGALRGAKFTAGSKMHVVHKKNKVEIMLATDGNKKVMDTARGELLELKCLKTAKSIGEHDYVTVTFREGKIVITAHGLSEKTAKREHRLIEKLEKGLPLRKACFFSGTGMLSYHISQGLKEAGVSSQIVFANEIDELSLSVNIESNPMWNNASEDAIAVCDSIESLVDIDLPEVDIVTVGYPCVGMSLLAKKENRDTLHPLVGMLFIPLVNALIRMNPSVVVFENTPRFKDSDTLSFIKRSMPGYNFEHKVFDGHDFGDLESRKRVCVVATSKGLNVTPISEMDVFGKENIKTKPKVSDYLDNIEPSSPLYREMAHVRKRDDMKHLGYKNNLYYGHETEMVTIPATYSSPKAGTPMIAHPTDPKLQRQLTVEEHLRLRGIPKEMSDNIMRVKEGKHPLVSTRGNVSACHRMLGNGVSKKVFTSIGSFLGRSLVPLSQEQKLVNQNT